MIMMKFSNNLGIQGQGSFQFHSKHANVLVSQGVIMQDLKQNILVAPVRVDITKKNKFFIESPDGKFATITLYDRKSPILKAYSISTALNKPIPTRDGLVFAFLVNGLKFWAFKTNSEVAQLVRDPTKAILEE